MTNRLARGTIWLIDFNPIKGHEQAGKRPALIISVETFNNGPADLVIAIPITTKERDIPLHIPIKAPEGGLHQTSFVMCEMIRSLSRSRLIKRLGQASPRTLELVEDRLRILLNL